jgi:hypothetical protein
VTQDSALPPAAADPTDPTVLARPAALPSRPLGLLAGLLLLLGILFVVLWSIQDGSEHHSFNSGATPPASVHITAGKQYEISTPGGIKRLDDAGIVLGTTQCTYATPGAGNTQQLPITVLGAGTRTVHAVATFIAPATGDFRINCAELPGTYVDDADNGAGDLAGLFVLLATLVLTVGAGLGLSVLYRRTSNAPGGHASGRPARRAAGGDHSHIATDE